MASPAAYTDKPDTLFTEKNRIETATHIIRLQSYARCGSHWAFRTMEYNFENVFLSQLVKHHLKLPDSEWYRVFLLPRYMHAYHSLDTSELRSLKARLDELHTVIVIKHPYACMASMLRWPGTRMFNSGDIGEQSLDVAKMMASYNTRYRNWYDEEKVKAGRWHVIRFETLLNAEDQCINQLAGSIGCATRVPYTVYTHELNSSGEPMRNEFSRHSFYKNHEYMDELSSEARKIIADTADWETLKLYGYTPEPPVFGD